MWSVDWANCFYSAGAGPCDHPRAIEPGLPPEPETLLDGVNERFPLNQSYPYTANPESGLAWALSCRSLTQPTSWSLNPVGFEFLGRSRELVDHPSFSESGSALAEAWASVVAERGGADASEWKVLGSNWVYKRRGKFSCEFPRSEASGPPCPLQFDLELEFLSAVRLLWLTLGDFREFFTFEVPAAVGHQNPYAAAGDLNPDDLFDVLDRESHVAPTFVDFATGGSQGWPSLPTCLRH